MQYLTGKGRPGRWTVVDRGLAEGLLLYEESLGDQGFPAWLAQDVEQRFAADEVIDHAAGAYEAYLAAVKKAGTELAPGTRIVVKHMGARKAPPEST